MRITCRPLVRVLAPMAVLVAAIAATAHGSAQTVSIPPALGDGWVTGAPDAVGIDVARLEQMTQSIRSHPADNIHAVLIEREGRLVYEEYFSGKDERYGRPLGVVTFNRNMLHDLRSMTKSVVSAMFGIANSSGAIPSLDAAMLDYFPEYKDLQTPERRRITLRHALSMSAGLEWHEDLPYTDPKNDEIAMDRSPDPIRYATSRPIVAQPGTVWNYSGGSPAILGAILQRVTKQSLIEYGREKIFAPLGITEFEWLGAHGPSPASGLRLRPRDAAKFGSVYLHDGRWRDQQVVPAPWVRESTRQQIAFPGGANRGYAYQWWHACYGTPSGTLEVPFAVGNGTQRIFLLRAHRTVVTVFAGRYNDFSADPARQLMLDFVVPALPKATLSKCPS